MRKVKRLEQRIETLEHKVTDLKLDLQQAEKDIWKLKYPTQYEVGDMLELLWKNEEENRSEVRTGYIIGIEVIDIDNYVTYAWQYELFIPVLGERFTLCPDDDYNSYTIIGKPKGYGITNPPQQVGAEEGPTITYTTGTRHPL